MDGRYSTIRHLLLLACDELIEIQQDSRERGPGGKLVGVNVSGQVLRRQEFGFRRGRFKTGTLLSQQIAEPFQLPVARRPRQAKLEGMANPLPIARLHLGKDTGRQRLGELEESLIV